MKLTTRWIIFGLSAMPWPVALGLEDCGRYLAAIDERIATSQAPEYNKQMAGQLRASVVQMCAFLDEATLNAMMTGLDELLPDTASMESMTASDAAGQQKLPNSTPAKTESITPTAPDNKPPFRLMPPTGRSVAARTIERPDHMNNLYLWDMDVHEGFARVLFTTAPSLDQLGDPAWQQYVYVAQIDPTGRSTLSLITSRQSQDHAALSLRRGHDEVIIQRKVANTGDSPALERWSLSKRNLLSTVPVPAPTWPDGSTWDWGPFREPTSDGNLFYNNAISTGSPPRSLVAWFEATPDGQVIGAGSRYFADSAGPAEWIETHNGGAGILLTVSARGDAGIETRAQLPISRTIADREIHAVVHHEKRLFETSDSETDAWQSQALERSLQWQGDLGIPQDLPAAEMLRQNQVQMTVIAEADQAYESNRAVVSLDVGLRRSEMVKPMRRGYAALTEVTANRQLNPPVHGPYLLQLDQTGITRTIRLTEIADALNARFRAMTVAPNDVFYLAGTAVRRGNDVSVVRLTTDGAMHSWARAANPGDLQLDGLLADATGVWILGHVTSPGRSGFRLWMERIDFSEV